MNKTVTLILVLSSVGIASAQTRIPITAAQREIVVNKAKVASQVLFGLTTLPISNVERSGKSIYVSNGLFQFVFHEDCKMFIISVDENARKTANFRPTKFQQSLTDSSAVNWARIYAQKVGASVDYASPRVSHYPNLGGPSSVRNSIFVRSNDVVDGIDCNTQGRFCEVQINAFTGELISILWQSDATYVGRKSLSRRDLADIAIKSKKCTVRDLKVKTPDFLFCNALQFPSTRPLIPTGNSASIVIKMYRVFVGDRQMFFRADSGQYVGEQDGKVSNGRLRK